MSHQLVLTLVLEIAPTGSEENPYHHGEFSCAEFSLLRNLWRHRLGSLSSPILIFLLLKTLTFSSRNTTSGNQIRKSEKVLEWQ